jgi:CRP/FNR family transcriptional regulator, anaerobic regulatory protein
MPAPPAFLESINGFLNTIKDRIVFTQEEMMMMLPFLKMNTYKKSDRLIAEGEVENNVHFIAEGVTRSFFIKDGRDISFEFYFTGMLISSYASFLTRMPSGHSIEAFAPLTTISIQHGDLMQLYEKSKKIEHLGRIFTEELFKKTSERNKDFLSLSATERYVKLLNQNPHYVQNVPLKYLASYLNVTPESLSRIRKSL